MCYWLALVVSHPIGATIGNYISKPEGWNLGNVRTSAALALLFAFSYSNKRLARLASGTAGAV